jgi:hypothetical protein
VRARTVAVPLGIAAAVASAAMGCGGGRGHFVELDPGELIRAG